MKALLFILVTIVLTSCGRKGDEIKEGSASIRVIDLLSEPESTISNLSDIATDVDYIPLETGKNSMIKFINKVIIRGDYIYINNAANEILCFDMNGKFINKLAAGGRGPGEYTGIMGFDVSSDNKMLILLSSNKIFEYSNTGSEFVFLKTIDLSRPAPLYSSFVPGTTNIMLSIPSWYGNESTLSLLVDINGDTLNLRENYYKYELVEKRHAFSTWDAIQYVMDDRVCFNEKLSDTVFCVSSESNNFMPWLILDSRGTLINTKIMSDVEYAKSHSSEYSQVAYIYEVPRYVFYYYRYKDLSHKIIYDKKENRKYEIALKEALKDNLSGGPDFNLNVYTSTAGYFYSSAEALALRKHVAGEDFAKADAQNPEKKEKLRKIADSLEDSDNPVLILVSPKQ